MPADSVLVADGGFAGHWSGLLYDTKEAGRHYIADRGLASIGYGLPGGMGAWLAAPDRAVVAISGDGGFNMTLGELETARRVGSGLTIVVVNNAASGYVKALRPDVRVVGVEPFEADAMYRSLAVGRRVQLDNVGIFADGVAVREVGERTFSLVQQVVDEVVRVTNDEICAAIKDVFDDTRSIMEPAGALAAAGLKVWVEREGARNQSPVAVLSGANINRRTVEKVRRAGLNLESVTDLGPWGVVKLIVARPSS